MFCYCIVNLINNIAITYNVHYLYMVLKVVKRWTKNHTRNGTEEKINKYYEYKKVIHMKRLVKNLKEWKKEHKNEYQQNLEMRNKFVQGC